MHSWVVNFTTDHGQLHICFKNYFVITLHGHINFPEYVLHHFRSINYCIQLSPMTWMVWQKSKIFIFISSNKVKNFKLTHNPLRSTRSLTPIFTRSFLDVTENVPDFSYSASTLGALLSMSTLRLAASNLCAPSICPWRVWESRLQRTYFIIHAMVLFFSDTMVSAQYLILASLRLQ